MPAFQPRFQGDEPASIKTIDSMNDQIVLKLRVMLRAAPESLPRHHAELRQLQRQHVNAVEVALREIER